MSTAGYGITKNNQTIAITSDLDEAKKLSRELIEEGEDSYIEVYPAAPLAHMSKLSWDQEVEEWVPGTLP